MSPTARTLKYYRDQGVEIGVVERWVPFFAVDGDKKKGGVRVDLFGFIDLIAITPEGIVGIQATSTGNASHRIMKIRTECKGVAAEWAQAGGQIIVIGWKKYVKKVDRKSWRPTIVDLTAEFLDD